MCTGIVNSNPQAYAVRSMYTIKEAAARTGVSIELLRAWERRYGIVEPSRTPGGYRVYDDASLDRLRAMRRLVDDGWTPSNAAAAIAAGRAPGSPTDRSPSAEAESGAAAAARFVAAAAELDGPAVERVLDEMGAIGSFEAIVDSHYLRALREIGDAWAQGRLSVSAEHAASQAVQRRLAAAFQAAARPGQGTGPLLVGLPQGSRHELGALAFAVAARRAGMAVLYLGSDVPVLDWAAAAGRTEARAAVIGVVTRRDVPPARKTAAALRGARPELLVAVGGPSARAFAADGLLVLDGTIVHGVDLLHDALGRPSRR